MALDIAIFSQSAMDRNCWPPTQNGFSSEPESNFEAYWVPKFEVIMECQAESLSNHVQPNISRLPSISNGRQVHLFVGPQKAQQHQRFWGSLTSPPKQEATMYTVHKWIQVLVPSKKWGALSPEWSPLTRRRKRIVSFEAFGVASPEPVLSASMADRIES